MRSRVPPATVVAEARKGGVSTLLPTPILVRPLIHGRQVHQIHVFFFDSEYNLGLIYVLLFGRCLCVADVGFSFNS